jgi:hypothetical protein
MRLQKVKQIKEEWHPYIAVIEAYLELRDRPVPYATLLNRIIGNDPDKKHRGLSRWAKTAQNHTKQHLFQIDCSNDKQFCQFLPDEDLFVVCPICLEVLNDEDIISCTYQCQAIFHKDCIYRWLRQNMDCPNCRSRMSGTVTDAYLQILQATDNFSN